jgi:DNA-binding response OmpR family regulator
MQEQLALIVEDDEAIAGVYQEALKRTGYKVTWRASGRQALDWLQRETPAVVILDLRLPDTTGEQVLRRIRADKRLARTQVIVTTGEARRAEALTEQADLVLVKPVSYSQLSELASRLWGAKGAGGATAGAAGEAAGN